MLHVTLDASVLNRGSAREQAVSISSAHQLQHLSPDATVLCCRFNLPRAKYWNAVSVPSLIPGISVGPDLPRCTRGATIKPAPFN